MHDLLQKQLRETGKVRALILKARQQGMCFTPDMRVLTADYKWIPINDIKVGDQLVACDENYPGVNIHGRSLTRRIRLAHVEAKREFRKEVVEVLFDNGACLKVTSDHRMLCKKRGADDQQWRHVADFKIGDHVRCIARPPHYESSYEDGWMGGIIDGEGSARGVGATKGGKRISINQCQGPVLDRIKAYFHNLDIPYSECIDNRPGGISSKLGNKAVHRIDIHRMPYIIELLSRCRPSRFIDKDWVSGLELPGKGAGKDGIQPWAKVISIQSIGIKRVIDIQTSTKTFICEGLVSHNSTYIGARLYHKATHNRGMQAFILTHSLEATNNLFKMAKRFYENTPDIVKPGITASNSKELVFGDLDSGYKLGTAENKNVGRSSTIQLAHFCLAEGSWIYNPDDGGLKYIENFEIGDKILTHNGHIAPISYISKKDKPCIEVLFRGVPASPLIATKEHKVWTPTGWKMLGELVSGDAVGYPISPITHEIFELTLPLPAIRKHGGGRQFKCPLTVPVNYDFGRIVGLYLAEGHLKLQTKAPNLPSNISFIVHRKEFDRTLEWVEPFKEYFSSINVCHRKDSLTSVITVYGSLFSSLIREICGRVETKRFPLEWRRMGEEFCRGMLHGYISGDGHSDPKNRRICVPSIRSSLIITTRDICASLGYGWCSVGYAKASIRCGRNEKAQYSIQLCGDGASRLAREIGKSFNDVAANKSISTVNYAPTATKIENGYAWLRIRSSKEAGLKTVYDFEVDHPDHSYCALQGAVSNSEVGFWNNAGDHATGIMQAIPDAPGTEVIMESTANGVGNYFHQQWQMAETGQSDFIAIFIPWFWQDEYSKEPKDTFIETPEESELKRMYSLSHAQLNWRRGKIVELSVNGVDGEKAFKQEYPSCSNEAFQLTGEDNYIPSDMVMSARKNSVEGYGPLVIGVDPARFGDDRTAIIRRQGRKAYGLESYTKKDTMEITGIVNSIIEREHPARVFVDVGGLGAGIVDRLHELGHRDIVVGVNAGASPLDGKRFFNKRSEMWALCREWLATGLVQIPDLDSLHADLCGITYKVDSVSRLKMESKADMKSRGIRSSDEADSLCLTFALPEDALKVKTNESKQLDELARQLEMNAAARASIMGSIR